MSCLKHFKYKHLNCRWQTSFSRGIPHCLLIERNCSSEMRHSTKHTCIVEKQAKCAFGLKTVVLRICGFNSFINQWINDCFIHFQPYLWLIGAPKNKLVGFPMCFHAYKEGGPILPISFVPLPPPPNVTFPFCSKGSPNRQKLLFSFVGGSSSSSRKEVNVVESADPTS